MPPKKLVFVGDSGVGKTTIIRRYVLDIPPHLDAKAHPTIGAAYYEVPKYSTTDRVAIWDTAGQERFKCLAPIYYRGSQGCICVFDVTHRASFDACEEWLRLFSTHCAFTDPFIILVGNKCDCDPEKRVVKDSEIGVLCELYDCEFIETDCINVTNTLVFDSLITRFVAQERQPIIEGIEVNEESEVAKCSRSCV